MASLSINSLLNSSEKKRNQYKRGENYYKSSHIEKFYYHEGVIRGEVHASMKIKVYKVTVRQTLDIVTRVRSNLKLMFVFLKYRKYIESIMSKVLNFWLYF